MWHDITTKSAWICVSIYLNFKQMYMRALINNNHAVYNNMHEFGMLCLSWNGERELNRLSSWRKATVMGSQPNYVHNLCVHQLSWCSVGFLSVNSATGAARELHLLFWALDRIQTPLDSFALLQTQYSKYHAQKQNPLEKGTSCMLAQCNGTRFLVRSVTSNVHPISKKPSKPSN